LVDQYGTVVNSYGVDSLDLADNDLSSSDNDSWFYANFNNFTGNAYSGYSFDYVFDSIVTGVTDSFSGTISGEYYSFIGTASWIFLIMNLFKLPFQIFYWKNITLETVKLDIVLVPSLAIGFVLGVFLVGKIRDEHYRKFVIILTLAGSALMLFR
jgi:hypothetical protein